MILWQVIYSDKRIIGRWKSSFLEKHKDKSINYITYNLYTQPRLPRYFANQKEANFVSNQNAKQSARV